VGDEWLAGRRLVVYRRHESRRTSR
jgi:hypothetical protein